MIKRFLIALVIMGLLVGGLAYFKLVFMPQMIKEIMDTVTIPVMAKARIGHFVECQARSPSSLLVPLLDGLRLPLFISTAC